MTSVAICYAEDNIRRTGSVVVHDNTQSKHTRAQPGDLLVCQEAAIVSPSPHTLQIHGHRLPPIRPPPPSNTTAQGSDQDSSTSRLQPATQSTTTPFPLLHPSTSTQMILHHFYVPLPPPLC
ncbi:hypothetical protein ACOMHN_005063 [Nucella lapillus]